MELTNKDYIQELSDLKNKMLAAEKFAEKFPYFKNQIIDEKITGENFVKFSGKYKDTYLAWGIYRSYHETSKNLTNYGNKHEQINKHLSNIYINTLTMYNRYDNFGLFDILDNCEVFYTDHTNSTFYMQDDQLINFLDKLNEWYLIAKVKAKELSNKEKVDKLELELNKLKV